LKFDRQLGTWLKKFKFNDQNKKDVLIQGLKLTKSSPNYKNWKFIGQLKVEMHKFRIKD
jgi:hypothetical protein